MLKGEIKKKVLSETKMEDTEEVLGDVKKLVLEALQEKGSENSFRFSICMVDRENKDDYEVMEDDG